MGSRIAPITPIMADSAPWLEYNQLATMFFILRGMSIQEANVRASQDLSIITRYRDQMNRIGKIHYRNDILAQQIAIAQHMHASILIIQDFNKSSDYLQCYSTNIKTLQKITRFK